MLFLLFGSSASGKTFVLDELRGRGIDLAIHDFDEIGVPARADAAWRHRADEEWVRRALDYQADGTDLLLAGQTPLGELLATPSAVRLEAVSACLIDCDDATRVTRLVGRSDSGADAADVQAYLAWADWMRRHVADPAWRPDVIHHPETEGDMQWSRWSSLQADDPRWRAHLIDTTDRAVEDVASDVLAWVDDERRLFRAGAHPLPGRRGS